MVILLLVFVTLLGIIFVKSYAFRSLMQLALKTLFFFNFCFIDHVHNSSANFWLSRRFQIRLDSNFYQAYPQKISLQAAMILYFSICTQKMKFSIKYFLQTNNAIIVFLFREKQKTVTLLILTTIWLQLIKDFGEVLNFFYPLQENLMRNLHWWMMHFTKNEVFQ